MDFELFQFKYSLKNIPLASAKEYQLQLVDSVSKFMNNIEWKANVFLHQEWFTNKQENFGFKSAKAPPKVLELKWLKDQLVDLVKDIEFRPYSNDFLTTLKKDIKTINESDKVLQKADKTSNFYKISKEAHENLLNGEVESKYRKASKEEESETTEQHQQIVRDFNLQKKLVYKTSNRPAFFTLKDHKPTFRQNPEIRLLNPQKPEVGRISKKLLEDICAKVKSKTNLNLFKNSYEVIDWFKRQTVRRNRRYSPSFVIFDISNYYPSVTEELLSKALDWASQFTPISEKDRKVIVESKNSFLYHRNSNWTKQSGLFNIGQGAYDGAESTDIVGLYMLSKIQHLPLVSGAFRDDGLGISWLSPSDNNDLKDELQAIFNAHGLTLDIKVNQTVVDYLDITLDITNLTYAPYMKPGDVKNYVHKLSNHPPAVIRNLPRNINDRLCRLSANKELFKSAIPPYQEALSRAGYDHKLTFYQVNRTNRSSGRRNRTRARNCVYFNPPFSLNVKTNILARFLKIIRNFPKNNPLAPIINTNLVKCSYRTMPNMAKQVSRKNGRILNNRVAPPPPVCNCQKRRGLY